MATTERPIIFTAESVRAILDGRKTMTRRLVKIREFQVSQTKGYDFTFRDRQMRWNDVSAERLLAKWAPYRTGERLWVKETFAFDPDWDGPGVIHYRATHPDGAVVQGGRWRSPLYMPRWASRLTLDVLSVRAERVQSITEEDALAEGIDANRFRGTDDCWDPANNVGREYRSAFEYAWGEMHGWDGQSRAKPGVTWSSNPFVWVVSFRRVP